MSDTTNLATRHDFRAEQPTRAEHGCSYYCRACDGFAAFCRACGGFDETLTMHCVGHPLTLDERARIVAGQDFVFGHWRLPDAEVAAATAAAWWRAAVEGPRDDAAAAGLTGARHAIAASVLKRIRRPLPDGAALAFERALAADLFAALGDCRYAWVGVDYDPDPKLAAACRAAGIRDSYLPWKTSMVITPTRVELARDDATLWLGNVAPKGATP